MFIDNEVISSAKLAIQFGDMINKFLDNNPDLDSSDRAIVYERILEWIEDVYIKIDKPSPAYIAMGISTHGRRMVLEYLASLKEDTKRMRSGVAIKRQSDISREMVEMALKMTESA